LASYPRYVVKKGDTLRKIAARPEIYGDAGRWQRIYEANRDIIGRDRKLNMGQVLMIPKP
jgi:nucleoid-associated protein YgaU